MDYKKKFKELEEQNKRLEDELRRMIWKSGRGQPNGQGDDACL